jgi:hypothetical protein
MTDPDGPPKKHTDLTDPDPQHWFHHIMMQFYGCTVTTHLDFICVCTSKWYDFFQCPGVRFLQSCANADPELR